MAYPMCRVHIGADLAPLRIAPCKGVVNRHSAFDQRQRKVRRRARGHQVQRVARRDVFLLDDDCKAAPSRRHDGAGLFRAEIASLRSVGSKGFHERGKGRLGRDF